MSNIEKIRKAKELLESCGYYCGNLWRVEDVSVNFECTDDEAYEVLDKALQNNATMEQIWYAIDFHAEDKGLKKIEE